MKKAVSLMMALLLALSLCTCVRAAPDPEPDYEGQMLHAAVTGDMEAGREAEELMHQHALETGAEAGRLSFDMLLLLSRAICCRFGGEHYSDELRLCMGELLLNRLDAPGFPDTLEGVISQAAAEGLIVHEAFNACLHPDSGSAEAALRLLRGERMMEADVLYMSGERRGEVYSMFCSSIWGNTYFLRGSAPLSP